MTYPKISIIIATYNVAQTIEGAIRSVLYQTYPNVELIIVDGASTDNTIEIIKKFELDFGNRLLYISEKDNGIYDAWNKGIEISSGEWIAFLGGDDYLVQDFCMNYYNVIINKPNLNFISSINLLVTEEDKPIRYYGKPINKDFVKYCTIAHVGSLHRKILFETFGNFDTNFLIAGDYDFLLRAKSGIVSFFMPKLSVIVRDGGISNKNLSNVFKEQMNAKLNNNARNSILCKLDFCIAYIKYIIRKYFYH